MKEIYKVGGSLPKGFIGQIAYSVCLDREYSSLDMEFSFDKRRYPEVTQEAIDDFTSACEGIYDDYLASASRSDLEDQVRSAKTEIHTIMYMNDCFIGGVHKQLEDRHMTFTPDFTSEGCLPQDSINGVIKVILVVFNVLMDDTHYTVSLRAE